VVASLALRLSAAASANQAELREEFAVFKNCPLATAKLCIYSTVNSGEFKIDLSTVPITKPLVLQGGLPSIQLTEQPLIAAVGAPTLAPTPLEVPGGLTGIPGIGGEVTATAEIAGPVSGIKVHEIDILLQKGVALTLPLKVKLDNPLLGNECYVGTEQEPLMLHLTTGTTEPPFPFSPLTGSRGHLVTGPGKGKIDELAGVTFVDNTFSVPGATGCGGALSPLIDLAVDAKVGIPAGPGFNSAVMNATLEETPSEYAEKYKPREKKKK
jgi:hypothetical protein